MQLLSQVFSVKMLYRQLITTTLSIYKNFSLGRVRQLQPRRRSGGHPSRSVPSHLQVRCGAVRPLGTECLGRCTQGQR